jgi:hypothetical protein
LIDIEKRAKLVDEINAPLIQGNRQTSLTDLDSKGKGLSFRQYNTNYHDTSY